MTENLGFANGNPNVVVDLGNSIVKMLADVVDAVTSGIHFIHARVEIDEAQYQRLAHGYRGTASAYQYIKWNGRYFVVGEDAFSAGDVIRLEGRQKYSRDYYGIIFVSGILRLFDGEVPEKINVFLAHPPMDHEQTGNLQKSVLGTWHIDNLGKRHTFRVEYASVFDEIIGGAMNVVLAPDGRRYNDHPIVEDGPTIVCDLGGGTFDIVRLKKDGTVDYVQIASKKVGVNDAVARFQKLFEARYPDIVGDEVDGLPIERVHECFMDPVHRFRYSGRNYIDCQAIYRDATQNLMNSVKEAYRTMTRGSMTYNHALITGGGGGLLYAELAEQIFPLFASSNALHMADNRNQMMFANAKGAKKLLVPLTEMSRKQVIKKQVRR